MTSQQQGPGLVLLCFQVGVEEDEEVVVEEEKDGEERGLWGQDFARDWTR
jgi:hypothetical protein